jgi:hypothetical protein
MPDYEAIGAGMLDTRCRSTIQPTRFEPACSLLPQQDILRGSCLQRIHPLPHLNAVSLRIQDDCLASSYLSGQRQPKIPMIVVVILFSISETLDAGWAVA